MGRPHETGLVYLAVDGLTLIEASIYFISLMLALALVLGARASVPSPGSGRIGWLINRSLIIDNAFHRILYFARHGSRHRAALFARQQHVAGKSQS